MKNECDIRIYDERFCWVGGALLAESVQITRDLHGPGHFEIHIHPDKMGALELARRNNVIVVNRDGRKSGIVRDFYVTAERGKTEFVVHGDTGAGLTKQRVTVPPTQAQDPNALGWDSVRGPAETVIKHYAARNLTAPFDPARRMPNLHMAPDLKRGMEVPWRSRYAKLDEALRGICAFADIGYEIVADTAGRRWVFDVVPGTDRSKSQSAVSPVVFNLEYQNVEGYRYAEDYQNYKNTGYAGGQGEDENRLVMAIGAENAGLGRHEVFLDCGNAEHVDELLHYGRQKLSEYAEAKTVEASALPRVFTFEKDYFLGDKVTVQIARLGLSLNVRVTSVKEVWERGTGHRAELRFGGKLPNIFTILGNGREVR